MKTTKHTLLGIAIILLSAMAAHAKLGETPSQIYQHYGPVKSRAGAGTNNWTGHYSADYWSVIITFQDGQSVKESFQPSWTHPLDAENIRILMNLSVGNTNWTGADFNDFTTNKYDGCLERKEHFTIDSLWTNSITGATACYSEALGFGDVPDRPILTIFAPGQR